MNVRLLTTLALALGCTGLLAASASAAHVQCGALVTQDVVLDGDLVGCPGDGLRIGADGVTVDLNGHTIDGSGAGNGVRITRLRGVTVQNGTVTGFGTGLRLEFADENRLLGLALRDNAGDGAFLLASSRNTLSGLAVPSNGATTFGQGVLVISGSDENVVMQSAFAGNAFTGVRVTNATRNRIAHNDFSAGDAIHLFGGSFETVVTANRLHASRGDGILVALAGNEGNVVSFNRVTDAGRDGIGVWDDAARTEVYRNRVTGSASAGIFVISSGGTVVEGNRTDENLNGIHISRTETTVTANRAKYNIEYGIRAGLPVTDGGHNRARGNGASAQCLNVVCK